MPQPTDAASANAPASGPATTWPIYYCVSRDFPQPPPGWLQAHGVLPATWLHHCNVDARVDIIGTAWALRIGRAFPLQSGPWKGRYVIPWAPHLPAIYDLEPFENTLKPPAYSAKAVNDVGWFATEFHKDGNPAPLCYVDWKYQFDFGNYPWQLRDLTTGFNNQAAVAHWQTIEPIAKLVDIWCPSAYTDNTALVAAFCDWYRGHGQPACYRGGRVRPLGPRIMPLAWGGRDHGQPTTAEEDLPIARALRDHAQGVFVWGGWHDSGGMMQALCQVRDERASQPIPQTAPPGQTDLGPGSPLPAVALVLVLLIAVLTLLAARWWRPPAVAYLAQ
jgi:hypothetical protein